MHRTIFALRNKNGKFVIPKFSECLLDFFGRGINSVIVKCSVENGILVLSESDEGHELRHSPECPIKLNTGNDVYEEQDKNESKTPYMGLAASVVVESSDAHILLTKRAAHMRASPNVWVFPGGNLECGETFLEAGAREIKEETALDITMDTASILGLWENVYPLLLGAGEPRYHILVIYLHAYLNEPFEELTKKIIPDPEEVDAYCWLNTSILSKLWRTKEDNKFDGKQYVFENGKVVEKYLNYGSMFNRWLRVQEDPYSGVNYALRKWMEKVNLKHQRSKY